MTESVFSGLRVVDCGSYIAAPAAATVFADFGADVIKIEPPAGDPYRHVSRLPSSPQSPLEYGALMTSRGKRGVAVDLATDRGREVVHRLAETADVFITNYPLPVREKLHVDYATISGLNDRLIYASFTGFGEVGGDATKPAFDTTAYWSRSGLMDQVRSEAGADPARSVPGLGDHPSAMGLYGAIVTALYERERTGRGTQVHSSLLANGLWANGFLATAALNGADFVPRPPREESSNALTCHYRCADDKWLVLAILNEDRQWPVLAECVGRTDLIDDPLFATKPDRLRNSRALVAILDEAFAKEDREHWRGVLRSAALVFEVVATPADLAVDSQVAANGFTVDFSDRPDVRVVSSPFTIDSAPKVPATLPPEVGQHTDDVLSELGYAGDEIAALRADGTIG